MLNSDIKFLFQLALRHRSSRLWLWLGLEVVGLGLELVFIKQLIQLQDIGQDPIMTQIPQMFLVLALLNLLRVQFQIQSNIIRSGYEFVMGIALGKQIVTQYFANWGGNLKRSEAIQAKYLVHHTSFDVANFCVRWMQVPFSAASILAYGFVIAIDGDVMNFNVFWFIPVGLAAALIPIFFWTRRRLGYWADQRSELERNYLAWTDQCIDQVVSIRSLGGESFFQHDGDERAHNLIRASFKLSLYRHVTPLLIEGVLPTVLLLGLAWYLRNGSALAIGGVVSLIAVPLVIFRLGPRLGEWIDLWYSCRAFSPEIRKYSSFLTHRGFDFFSHGRIFADRRGLHLIDYSFGFGTNSLVEPLTLSIAPGSHISLLGPNGSGKSTLALAISGFLGSRPLNVSAYLVRGDELLFAGSIRTNLAVDPSVTQEILLANLEVVGLRHFATRLDESVETLSTGERQRLLLARALMSPAQILILDEVFSGLPDGIESLISNHLRRNKRKQILIAISHRNSSTDWFDFELRFEKTSDVSRIVIENSNLALSHSGASL